MLIYKIANGFYPANQSILEFIKDDEKTKYIGNFIPQNETFPLNLVLISKKANDRYYQKITVFNEVQRICLLQLALKVANVIYEKDFINTNKIQKDYILNFSQLKTIFCR